jgi:hypothetical protein
LEKQCECRWKNKSEKEEKKKLKKGVVRKSNTLWARGGI